MNPPLMYSTYPSSRPTDIETPVVVITPKEVDEVHSVFYVVLICYFTAMFFVLHTVIHDTEPHWMPPYNRSTLCDC